MPFLHKKRRNSAQLLSHSLFVRLAFPYFYPRFLFVYYARSTTCSTWGQKEPVLYDRAGPFLP